MAENPLTAEAIALAEKKVGMTLDDLIKMSKAQHRPMKKQRVPNKTQGRFFNRAAPQEDKARALMGWRSRSRQRLLAERRFQGQQPTSDFDRMSRGRVNSNRPRAGAHRNAAIGGGYSFAAPKAPATRISVFDRISSGVQSNPTRPPLVHTKEGAYAVNPRQQFNKNAQRPQTTMDSLFPNTHAQRRRIHNYSLPRNGGVKPWKQQPRRGRFGN